MSLGFPYSSGRSAPSVVVGCFIFVGVECTYSIEMQTTRGRSAADYPLSPLPYFSTLFFFFFPTICQSLKFILYLKPSLIDWSNEVSRQHQVRYLSVTA